MSRLVREYQKPDGDLDSENVEQVATEIASTVERASTGAPVELTDSLVGNLQELDEGQKPKEPPEDAEDAEFNQPTNAAAGQQTILGNKIDIGARIRVHHICRGWADDAPIDEKENGSAELQVALDQRGLLPTVWGHVDGCRLKRSGVNLELTGDLSIRFGTTQDRVGLRALNQVGYLVQFKGRVRAMRGDEEREIDGTLSFRVLPNRHVQVKVDLPDGTNVVFVVDSAELQPDTLTFEGGLLTRDADWTCKINLASADGSCVDETGADLDLKW